jgi:hypothetical protein
MINKNILLITSHRHKKRGCGHDTCFLTLYNVGPFSKKYESQLTWANVTRIQTHKVIQHNLLGSFLGTNNIRPIAN